MITTFVAAKGTALIGLLLMPFIGLGAVFTGMVEVHSMCVAEEFHCRQVLVLVLALPLVRDLAAAFAFWLQGVVASSFMTVRINRTCSVWLIVVVVRTVVLSLPTVPTMPGTDFAFFLAVKALKAQPRSARSNLGECGPHYFPESGDIG